MLEVRGPRSAVAVASEASVSIGTLRKIERGAIAVPAFCTVASLARVLDLDLSTLARNLDEFDKVDRCAAAS